MARLNPLERQVLQLRLQDCTIEEIARQVQRGERTVRRALDAIRCRFAAFQADVP
jgi:DNA-binding CsgD family transcriptional regulator